MNKLSILREAFTAPNTSKEVADYVKSIEDGIREIFPDSAVDVEFSSGLGYSLMGRFTLGKDRSEYVNGIIQNDPMHFIFSVNAVPDESAFERGAALPKTLTTGGGSYDRFRIQFKDYDYFKNPGALLKTSLRKKTGTPEQIRKHIIDFFAKTKQALQTNKDNLKNPLFQEKL